MHIIISRNCHVTERCVCVSQHYLPEGSNEWLVRRIPREETERTVEWVRKGA